MSGHKGPLTRNSGLGLSDKSKTSHCFKIHPGLVLDSDLFTPLGVSHIKVFHRPLDMPNRIERKYKKQPIEQKESYKWLEDLEGNIFKQFAIIPDKKHQEFEIEYAELKKGWAIRKPAIMQMNIAYFYPE